MTQDFWQILYKKGDYSKFWDQRMLRLFDQKLLDNNQEYPNLIYIFPELSIRLPQTEDFFHKAWVKIIWKFQQKMFLDVLRSLVKKQILILNLYMMCCNFCIKTSELVSNDFRFSLEKKHLKTSKQQTIIKVNHKIAIY